MHGPKAKMPKLYSYKNINCQRWGDRILNKPAQPPFYHAEYTWDDESGCPPPQHKKMLFC